MTNLFQPIIVYFRDKRFFVYNLQHLFCAPTLLLSHLCRYQIPCMMEILFCRRDLLKKSYVFIISFIGNIVNPFALYRPLKHPNNIRELIRKLILGVKHLLNAVLLSLWKNESVIFLSKFAFSLKFIKNLKLKRYFFEFTVYKSIYMWYNLCIMDFYK